ncbi:MAG: TonB-dependent receptor [Bacteroidota bacterium]
MKEKMHRNLNNIFILLILFVVSNHSLFAQGNNDDLNNKVVVVKDAQVSIQEGDKIIFVPQIIEKEIPVQSFECTTEDKFINIEYTPTNLKAQAIKKEAPIEAQNSYLKVGFGSLLSPYAELNYNDIVKQKFTYGIKYKFWMAQGKLDNQKMNQHLAGIYADYVAHKNLKLGFNLNFDRNTHHFYGYNLNNDTTDYLAPTIRQTVNHFDAKVYFTNPTKNKWKVDYKQTIGFSYMFARNKNVEYAIYGTTSFNKQFLKKHFLNIDFTFDINKLTYLGITDSIKRNIFNAGASYSFDDDNWNLKAGLRLAFDQSTTYLFPNLITEKRLYKHYLIFYSAWNRELQKNTYYSFVSQNPYINTILDIKNTTVENRIAGFKGTIQNFDYDIRFTNKVVKRMPLFVNDPTDMKRFNVIYDRSVQVINLQVEASYTYNENLKFDFTGNYFLYEPLDELKAWHMPALTGNLRATYFWNNKLQTYIDIFGLTGAYAKAKDGSAIKLKGAVDINLGGEYKVHKYIGIFLDAKNIAHMKYQNYYLYPQFGANVTIGVRLRY